MSILRAFALFIAISSLFLAVSATLPHHHHRINVNITLHRSKTHHHTHYYHRRKPRSLSAQFLIAHNVIRAYHNLEPLKWNRSLARYARRWLNQRVNDCQLIHSPNNPYGENMFWSLKSHWNPFDVVRCWGEEYKHYNLATNECMGNNICGHYTQIIWKKTKRLGCGRVQCHNNKGFLYACAYDPPGNFYFEGPLGGHFKKSIIYPPPPSE